MKDMVKCSDSQVIARINMLRGLFAILIVLGHCSMRFEKELFPLMFIHKFNMVSVCFFFMASGISLSYNFEHKEGYLKGFIRNKIILLAVFALIAQLIGKAISSIVLGEYFALDVRILTGMNWYIYEMAVLYLIFYMVNKYVKKSVVKETLFYLSALIICLVTLYFFRHGSWEGWSPAYYYSTFSFPFGITLYLHFDAIQKSLMRHPLPKAIVLLCVAVSTCISLTMPNDSIWGGVFLRNTMGGCIMTLLFMFLNYVDVNENSVIGKAVSFLTGFSTEIYLYQFCLLELWASVYGRMRWDINLTYVCAVTGSTIVLGYVMHFVDAGIAKAVKDSP